MKTASQCNVTRSYFSAVNKTNLNPSYLWHFGSSVNNSVALDEVSGRVVHLEGGAFVTNTTEGALVTDTNGGWLSLKETNGEWLRYRQASRGYRKVVNVVLLKEKRVC